MLVRAAQMCGNDPAVLLDAGRVLQEHCDAIDLNLGCPQVRGLRYCCALWRIIDAWFFVRVRACGLCMASQGIARRGRYGAFLLEGACARKCQAF